MKIERFYGNSPEPTKAAESTQPAVKGTQPSPAETAGAASSANQQSAARAHATSQKGNLDLYGVTRRWKLSAQKQQNTPDGSSVKNSSTRQSGSQTAARLRMQSFSTGSSAPPSFTMQRRNAVSYPSVVASSQHTRVSTPSGKLSIATPGPADPARVPTPAGNLPIAKPADKANPSDSGGAKSTMLHGTESGVKNKSWNYQYKKSINLSKSSGDQSTDSSTTPKSSAPADDQGFTQTKRKSNIARGSGALTAYGEGQTTSESGSSVKSWDKTFAEGEGYQVNGEAAALEARSRTYEYDSGLGVGAQAEASLIRGKVGVQGSASHMVGGAEVVGVSGHAGVDGMVGARTTAEAGVGVGRDGLPAVRVGAEAFVGARVDARAGGEARLMGVGADATGTASAMAGAQANTEASLGLTGMQASASAFAGASVGTSGSASVAGVGASGSAEAWAGVGAKAELDAGYTDGKLEFKFGAGAALGVGGAVSSGFTWDLNQTKTDAERLAQNTNLLIASEAQKAAPALNAGAREVGRLATGAAEQAEAGFRTVSTGAQAATQAASTQVSKLSSNMEQTVTSTAKAVANAANANAGTAVKAVSTGAKTVAGTASSAVKSTAKAATTATKTVSSAAKSAGKAASNVAKSISKWF